MSNKQDKLREVLEQILREHDSFLLNEKKPYDPYAKGAQKGTTVNRKKKPGRVGGSDSASGAAEYDDEVPALPPLPSNKTKKPSQSKKTKKKPKKPPEKKKPTTPVKAPKKPPVAKNQRIAISLDDVINVDGVRMTRAQALRDSLGKWPKTINGKSYDWSDVANNEKLWEPDPRAVLNAKLVDNWELVLKGIPGGQFVRPYLDAEILEAGSQQKIDFNKELGQRLAIADPKLSPGITEAKRDLTAQEKEQIRKGGAAKVLKKRLNRKMKAGLAEVGFEEWLKDSRYSNCWNKIKENYGNYIAYGLATYAAGSIAYAGTKFVGSPLIDGFIRWRQRSDVTLFKTAEYQAAREAISITDVFPEGATTSTGKELLKKFGRGGWVLGKTVMFGAFVLHLFDEKYNFLKPDWRDGTLKLYSKAAGEIITTALGMDNAVLIPDAFKALGPAPMFGADGKELTADQRLEMAQAKLAEDNCNWAAMIASTAMVASTIKFGPGLVGKIARTPAAIKTEMGKDVIRAFLTSEANVTATWFLEARRYLTRTTDDILGRMPGAASGTAFDDLVRALRTYDDALLFGSPDEVIAAREALAPAIQAARRAGSFGNKSPEAHVKTLLTHINGRADELNNLYNSVLSLHGKRYFSPNMMSDTAGGTSRSQALLRALRDRIRGKFNAFAAGVDDARAAAAVGDDVPSVAALRDTLSRGLQDDFYTAFREVEELFFRGQPHEARAALNALLGEVSDAARRGNLSGGVVDEFAQMSQRLGADYALAMGTSASQAGADMFQQIIQLTNKTYRQPGFWNRHQKRIQSIFNTIIRGDREGLLRQAPTPGAYSRQGRAATLVHNQLREYLRHIFGDLTPPQVQTGVAYPLASIEQRMALAAARSKGWEGIHPHWRAALVTLMSSVIAASGYKYISSKSDKKRLAGAPYRFPGKSTSFLNSLQGVRLWEKIYEDLRADNSFKFQLLGERILSLKTSETGIENPNDSFIKEVVKDELIGRENPKEGAYEFEEFYQKYIEKFTEAHSVTLENQLKNSNIWKGQGRDEYQRMYNRAALVMMTNVFIYTLKESFKKYYDAKPHLKTIEQRTALLTETVFTRGGTIDPNAYLGKARKAIDAISKFNKSKLKDAGYGVDANQINSPQDYAADLDNKITAGKRDKADLFGTSVLLGGKYDRGTFLGLAGRSGMSNAPGSGGSAHLHLDIKRAGDEVDPNDVINKDIWLAMLGPGAGTWSFLKQKASFKQNRGTKKGHAGVDYYCANHTAVFSPVSGVITRIKTIENWKERSADKISNAVTRINSQIEQEGYVVLAYTAKGGRRYVPLSSRDVIKITANHSGVPQGRISPELKTTLLERFDDIYVQFGDLPASMGQRLVYFNDLKLARTAAESLSNSKKPNNSLRKERGAKMDDMSRTYRVFRGIGNSALYAGGLNSEVLARGGQGYSTGAMIEIKEDKTGRIYRFMHFAKIDPELKVGQRVEGPKEKSKTEKPTVKEAKIMSKKELSKIVQEVLSESRGGSHNTHYPYEAETIHDISVSEEYMQEWKELEMQVVRDTSRNKAIEIAKLLVKDLELFGDVLDLAGQNHSVGTEILALLKQSREIS